MKCGSEALKIERVERLASRTLDDNDALRTGLDIKEALVAVRAIDGNFHLLPPLR